MSELLFFFCCCCCCYGFVSYREEGFLAFWKGNGVNIIRIFPYSAAQLAANDSYKRLLAGVIAGGNPTGSWSDAPTRIVFWVTMAAVCAQFLLVHVRAKLLQPQLTPSTPIRYSM
jgi:hypothetical protein